MKWKPVSSRYRYCISRFSRIATSTGSSARKVRSRTRPVRTFFSLVRTGRVLDRTFRADELEPHDVHEVAVEVERHAVLQVVGGRHGPTLPPAPPPSGAPPRGSPDPSAPSPDPSVASQRP